MPPCPLINPATRRRSVFLKDFFCARPHRRDALIIYLEIISSTDSIYTRAYLYRTLGVNALKRDARKGDPCAKMTPPSIWVRIEGGRGKEREIKSRRTIFDTGSPTAIFKASFVFFGNEKTRPLFSDRLSGKARAWWTSSSLARSALFSLLSFLSSRQPFPEFRTRGPVVVD